MAPGVVEDLEVVDVAHHSSDSASPVSLASRIAFESAVSNALRLANAGQRIGEAFLAHIVELGFQLAHFCEERCNSSSRSLVRASIACVAAIKPVHQLAQSAGD